MCCVSVCVDRVCVYVCSTRVETFSSSRNVAMRKTDWLLSLPFQGQNDTVKELPAVALASPQTPAPPFAEQ